MMNVLIRIAAQAMHPFEVAFFRCLFGLFFILPWIVKGGPLLLRSRNRGFFLLRAGVGLVSMATWFYGITMVPLATATAVNFTAPLFATMAAVLILHEDVRLRRWSAVVIGFVGVLVIMRPGSAALDVNLFLLLLSAATGAMNNITVKFLARTEPHRRVLYDLPYPLVADTGAVCLAVAGSVDLWCADRARRPWNAGAPFRRGRSRQPTPAPARLSNLPACPLPRLSASCGLARSPISGRGWARRSSPFLRSMSRTARPGSRG